MMNFTLRRRMLAALAALGTLGVAALSALTLPGQAQTYPDRPIRLMHGFAAGGNADTVARILGTAMSQKLGQPIVVEPKPGAGGTLAGDAVAKSKPDGYTLLLATGGHAIAAAMYDKLPYDTLKSFQPVSAVTSFSFLVVVNAASPHQNLQQLLAAARARATPLTYGSAGIGTGQHMTGALLAHKTGVAATHVPYRGDAASVTAALGGEVDFILAPPTAALPHIRAGKLRALAISGNTRWSGLPEVPTVQEQGVRDYDVRSWTALLAPAGTPAAVVDRLNTTLRTVLADAAVRQKLEEATGGEVRANAPPELGAAIQSDVRRWTDLVRDTRMQRD